MARAHRATEPLATLPVPARWFYCTPLLNLTQKINKNIKCYINKHTIIPRPSDGVRVEGAKL